MNKFFTEEYQQLWALSKYPKSFYLLLGFTYSQYAGTFDMDNATIQKFITYDTVSELEKNKFYNLNIICSNLINDLEVTNDLEIKTDKITDNRVVVSFISGNICTFFKSISFKQISDLFIGLFKPPFGTYALALHQRMEFLIGTYLYHYIEEGKFIFYNNYEKTVLTHQFMVDLSDEEDEIYLTSKFMTPHCHKIELNKEGVLWATMKNILNDRGFKM